MNDFERLLDSNFPFVKDLLMEYGEFFPLACGVKINHEITQIGTFDGNDHPDASKVLDDLKEGLKTQKSKYRTILIFYDVSTDNFKTREKTDAVAVFAESKDEENSFIFYYPYKLTEENELSWQEPWKEICQKEIFNE